MQKTESGSIVTISTATPGTAEAFQWWPVLVAVVVVAAAGVVAYLVLSRFLLRRFHGPSASSTSPTERQFRNVFAMMTEDRREDLIRYHRQKHECGREEAMRRAMEDRSRDESRW